MGVGVHARLRVHVHSPVRALLVQALRTREMMRRVQMMREGGPRRGRARGRRRRPPRGAGGSRAEQALHRCRAAIHLPRLSLCAHMRCGRWYMADPRLSRGPLYMAAAPHMRLPVRQAHVRNARYTHPVRLHLVRGDRRAVVVTGVGAAVRGRAALEMTGRLWTGVVVLRALERTPLGRIERTPLGRIERTPHLVWTLERTPHLAALSLETPVRRALETTVRRALERTRRVPLERTGRLWTAAVVGVLWARERTERTGRAR